MRVITNPKIYSPTPKTKKSSSGSKLGCVLVLLIIVTGAFYFFLFSQYFEIRNIMVSGSKTISDESIKEVFTKYQKQQNNIFLFPSKNIELELLEKYPIFSQIIITKGIPDSIKVEIQERSGIVVLKSDNRLFLIDMQGIVFEEIDQVEDMPIIERDENLELGDKVFTIELVEFILQLVDNFSAYTYMKIEKIEILDTVFELNLWTSKDYKVVFDTTKNVQDQLDTLAKVLPEVKGKKIEYIDLRLGEKVFYK